MKLYQRISQKFDAYLNCIKSNNKIWEDKHKYDIEELVKNNLPSGSGFDSGTHFDFDKSKNNKLIFNTSYHFMDENGMYDGWENYKIEITPDLSLAFNIKIIGKNKNDIKDYILDCFCHDLGKEIE
jgi:hypothetical protein